MTFMSIVNPTDKSPTRDPEASDENRSFDEFIRQKNRLRGRNSAITQRVHANAFSSKVLQKRSRSLVEESKAPSVIRVARSFRIKWDLFVMVLATWNCFLTPFFLTFKVSHSPMTLAIDLAIDLIFFCDIFLNFRTSFFSSLTGDEVLDPRKIRKNYLVGKFWIDLISCVPADLLQTLIYDTASEPSSTSFQNVWNLLSLLKIYRISRFNRIVKFMRTRSAVKMLIKIFQLILFILMYIHLLACSWWIIVTYDETWILPRDFIYSETDVYQDSKGSQYWSCFYYAVLLLTGGDIGPRTTLHAAFGGFMVLIGAIITAIMFGDISVLINNLNMRQTQFQHIQNDVNTAMKNMKLPENLQRKISDYLVYTEASFATHQEFDLFKAYVSPTLYAEVLSVLYDKVIRNSVLFENCLNIIGIITPKLQPYFVKPEEVLITQGETADQIIYFIAKGDCKVVVTDEKAVDRLVGVLGSGEHFGEVSMVTKGPRTASVSSLKYCTFARITFKDMEDVIETYPSVLAAMKSNMHLYRDKYKRFLLRCLRRVPYLGDLSFEAEQDLVYHLKICRYSPGEYLVKPGMPGNQLFFITKGLVEVAVTVNDKHLIGIRNMEPSNERWDPTLLHENLKRFTEIYPVTGSVGIEKAVHYTELKPTDTVLGKYCVELKLDHLHPGSALGFMTTAASESYSIQAKSLTETTSYTLDYDHLRTLRHLHMDLHDNLVTVECWSKEFTVDVADYNAVDERKHGANSSFLRPQRRFRGAILKVIKENRESSLVKVPAFALMIKKLRQQQSVSSTLKKDLIQMLLSKSFSPEFIKQKQEKQSEDINFILADLNSTVERNTGAIRDIARRLLEFLRKNKRTIRTSIATQTEEHIDEVYRTVTFKINH